MENQSLGIRISFAIIYISLVTLLLFLSISITIRFSSRFFISINNLITASEKIGKGNLDANFSVKNFKNLLESVNSYLLNLNTHPAYKKLRNFRISQYNAGKNVTGNDMANFLEKYAEIGFEYITKVKSMIKKNQLSKFENSILATF